MKHYSIKENVTYPVGDNPSGAIYTAKNMAKAIFTNNLIDPGEKEVKVWCRGSSGAIIAALLVAELKNLYGDGWHCTIKHIKKPGEESHSSSVYTATNFDYNIIVDDFIHTGSTINAIYDKVFPPNVEVDILAVGRLWWGNMWKLSFIPTHLICQENDENQIKDIQSNLFNRMK